MSSDHFACLSTGSTLSPISLTPCLSNSGFSLASAPSSVVQTGVKSFGCENKSAQLLPIQSWNLILPSVVSASKSGATAPIGRAIVDLIPFRLGENSLSRSVMGQYLFLVGEMLFNIAHIEKVDEGELGR